MVDAGSPEGAVHRETTGMLALGALGVVYGDIGTSPLYTMKTALEWGGGATPEVALGMLSLIVWTLIIITSIKYVALIMRADNDGEGGILALMSLSPQETERRDHRHGHARRGVALWRWRDNAGHFRPERARRPERPGSFDRALRRAAVGRRAHWSFSPCNHKGRGIGIFSVRSWLSWFVVIGLLGLVRS